MAITFVSALLLFTELALIRWIGTEVNVFAYLQNILLICCFMGFGIGLCTDRRTRAYSEFVTPLFILVSLLTFRIFREALGRSQWRGGWVKLCSLEPLLWHLGQVFLVAAALYVGAGLCLVRMRGPEFHHARF